MSKNPNETAMFVDGITTTIKETQINLMNNIVKIAIEINDTTLNTCGRAIRISRTASKTMRQQ